MKLVALAQCYNENSHRGWDDKTNLQRYMESISKYCDGLVMFDDGSTDDSKDFVLGYLGEGTLGEVEVLGNPPGENNFENELYHKARALEHCKRLGADWVIRLDVDECIQAQGERGGVKALCESLPEDVDAVDMLRVNLWRTDRFARVDGLWAHGVTVHLWRMNRALTFDISPGLHQSQTPVGLKKSTRAALKVIHYGFADDESLLRKYHTYAGYGQSGVALDRLIDESSLRLMEARPKWFSDKGWPHGPGVEVYNKRLRELV